MKKEEQQKRKKKKRMKRKQERQREEEMMKIKCVVLSSLLMFVDIASLPQHLDIFDVLRISDILQREECETYLESKYLHRNSLNA